MTLPPIPDRVLRVTGSRREGTSYVVDIQLQTRSPAFILWFLRVAARAAPAYGVSRLDPRFWLATGRALADVLR